MMSGASSIFTLVAQIQDEYGIPTYGLGLITGVYFLGSLIAQLGLSKYADRGFARVLLVVGMTSSVVSLLGFGISSSLWQFVLFRFFGGVGEGCWLPGARAVIIKGRIEESGKLLGNLTAAQLGGITLGPLFGVLLFNAGSLRLPFLVGGFACLAIIPFLLRIRLPKIEFNRQTDKVGSILVLLRRRSSLLALLFSIAVFLPVGIYDALWARFLEDIGASTFFVGVSFLLYGLPFVIFTTYGGALADRFGAVRLSLITIFLEVPIVALYGHMERPGILVVLSVIEGVVAAAAFPACQSAMARACKSYEQALGQGLAGGASFAIGGIMAVVAAPLYGSIGPEWTFGIAALVVFGIWVYALSLSLIYPETEAA